MFEPRTKITGHVVPAVLAVCFVFLEGCGASRGPAGDGNQAMTCAKIPSASGRAPACHWRRINYPQPPGIREVAEVEEGWEIPGAGRRVEIRIESRLVSVTVDTPRWRFVWDVRQNPVAAHPSQLQDPVEGGASSLFATREGVIRRMQECKATYVSEKDVVDGKEVERITFRCLADPAGDSPIHGFDPGVHQKLLQSSDAKFRTRTYGFDPKTHFVVGYQCGCKSPKIRCRIDYPAPESVPRDLFTFRVPREATLEVNDPELGRQVYSEGQTGPDLRQ